jgi:hypothetical protein
MGEYAVRVVEPERMSLLGLMVAGMLERVLRDPGAVRHAMGIDGPVALEAGGMQVHLRFGPREVSVTRGPVARPVARLRGSLRAFLDAAIGRRRVEHVVRGQLRLGGRPRPLLHLGLLLSRAAR